MAYDLEEQESLDQLKAWWEKWGNLVTTVVTVICVAFAGFNGWKLYQRNQGTKATAAYVQLQNAVVHNDVKNIKSLADGIKKDYSGHVFAVLAAFTSASQAQMNGKLDEARDELLWVINSGSHPEYETVARIRLAGIELDRKDLKSAMKVLSECKPTEDEILSYKDRLGDVYYAMGDYAKAKQVWTEAQAKDPNGANLGALIALKLDSVPQSTK